MSATKQDAPSPRRRFTEEFKQDAVRLVDKEGDTFVAAAKAVGVSEQSLWHWPDQAADFTKRDWRQSFQRTLRFVVA